MLRFCKLLDELELLRSTTIMAASDTTRWLLLSGVTGAGLLSGLYFIFSFCVMWALNEQAPASARRGFEPRRGQRLG